MEKSYKYNKLVLIYDFESCDYGVGPNILKMVMNLIKIITKQYPNSLHKCYCINCSKLFYISYKIVSSILDKETVKKIIILNKKNNLLENKLNIWNNLKDCIDTRVIERKYGGCHEQYKSF